MISVKPINNAQSLEVRKKKFGLEIELTAIFGLGITTKAKISTRDLKASLEQPIGEHRDFDGSLRRVVRTGFNHTHLFFKPNSNNDLVVVETSDLLIAIS
ncbi:MAG: hypothetical protein HYV90_01720 [Candidatus Woesebacteria bacterium]|nr:MAG: hypothetical protein HYV90_01720 [Candidatus Woesebacteria bacterium]